MLQKYKEWFNGFVLVLLVSLASYYVANLPAVATLHISPLIIGVVFGIFASPLFRNAQDSCEKAVVFSAKKLLRLGIILYGFNVTLGSIASVGLSERIHNFPSQLSGGEQQRVAIARALAKNPKLLLCDEPTGALDYQTGKQVLKVLQKACKEQQKTVIVITHNLALCPMGDKVIKVKSGKIDSISINENPMDVDRIEY